MKIYRKPKREPSKITSNKPIQMESIPINKSCRMLLRRQISSKWMMMRSRATSKSWRMLPWRQISSKWVMMRSRAIPRNWLALLLLEIHSYLRRHLKVLTNKQFPQRVFLPIFNPFLQRPWPIKRAMQQTSQARSLRLICPKTNSPTANNQVQPFSRPQRWSLWTHKPWRICNPKLTRCIQIWTSLFPPLPPKRPRPHLLLWFWKHACHQIINCDKCLQQACLKLAKPMRLPFLKKIYSRWQMNSWNRLTQHLPKQRMQVILKRFQAKKMRTTRRCCRT